MKRITETINSLKQTGIMTHVVCGYPNLEATEELILAMADEGVTMIELQIPFSDPIADGPTIMEACRIALEENKIKVQQCLDLMSRVSKKVETPLIFMGYYNIILNYGVKKFCQDAKTAGAAGLIIPDIPPDEDKEGFYEACRDADLDTILTLAPVSTQERIKIVDEYSRGFIYCMARMGTTGTKEDIPERTKTFLTNLRKESKLPLSIGFGISKPKHIAFIKDYADVIVIGSKIIDIINESKPEKRIQEVREFLKEMTKACEN